MSVIFELLTFSALTSEKSGIIIITPGTPKPITSKRFIASLNLNLNLASPYAAGAQINILKNTDELWVQTPLMQEEIERKKIISSEKIKQLPFYRDEDLTEKSLFLLLPMRKEFRFLTIISRIKSLIKKI